MMLLFGINSYAQNYSKEQIKAVEQEAASIKTDTTTIAFYNLKTENDFDLDATKTFQTLDSILVFIAIKKQDKANIFEDIIAPYLEVKSNELDLKTLNFSEDEKLIYDSFLQVLEWRKAIEIVSLYEGFILKSYKEPEKMESVLTVLSFIKYLHFYIKGKEKLQSESFVYKCLAENFEENNEVDWRVFALDPARLIFWTITACAWDVKSEK